VLTLSDGAVLLGEKICGPTNFLVDSWTRSRRLPVRGRFTPVIRKREFLSMEKRTVVGTTKA
jgi:hypothetical protein